mmetsp:Transcript_18391/g.47099  ORF Transcript_18391/g.47099 Transcript_18391/m.47099 type:complete len:225 (+) Transcript_18391:1423-2097(+)
MAPKATICPMTATSSTESAIPLRLIVLASTSIIFIDLDALNTRRMRVRRTMRTMPSTLAMPFSPPMRSERSVVTYQGRIATRSSRLSGSNTNCHAGMTTPHESSRARYSAVNMKMQLASITLVVADSSMRTAEHCRVPPPSGSYAFSHRQKSSGNDPITKFIIERMMTKRMTKEMALAIAEDEGSSNVVHTVIRHRDSALGLPCLSSAIRTSVEVLLRSSFAFL